MKYENGGTKVREGFYWGIKTWDVQVIERGGGTLPGDDTRRYLRIPALAMLLLGPVMGALFAMFLPFIGLAMFADHAGRAIGRRAKRAFGRKTAEVKAKR
jgi:hypothetical protein